MNKLYLTYLQNNVTYAQIPILLKNLGLCLNSIKSCSSLHIKKYNKSLQL